MEHPTTCWDVPKSTGTIGTLWDGPKHPRRPGTSWNVLGRPGTPTTFPMILMAPTIRQLQKADVQLLTLSGTECFQPPDVYVRMQILCMYIHVYMYSCTIMIKKTSTIRLPSNPLPPCWRYQGSELVQSSRERDLNLYTPEHGFLVRSDG